jgi:GDP-mannose 6-dehydrogenase
LKVAVFGLGYVGAVTAACLTRDGHTVAGVDVNPDKVALVAAGRSPFVEPGLDELMATGVACGRLTATTDASAAALASDICLISVGTPNTESGLHDTTQVMTVCEQIAGALAGSPSERIIVLRSTVPPGTLNLCRELLESSGCDGSIHFAFNPEFLREGSAISDYNDPPYTVIGTDDPAAAAAVRELYARVGGSVFTVAPAVAELVKSVANAWHATKITFANEVGRLATAFGVDGREVMDVIARDTKLNVSPAYMRPGYAYGGSCLPKDTRSLIAWGREFELLLPLLESLPASNEAQIDTAVRAVLEHRPHHVLVCGLAFKRGTDDLRESPAVPLIERLLSEGCEVRVFDPDVRTSHLVGINLAYIRDHLPHFEALFVDAPAESVAWADTAVVTYTCPEFAAALNDLPAETPLVDLTGSLSRSTPTPEYRGVTG